MIGGYASIEIVDKQNDLITLEALKSSIIEKFKNFETVKQEVNFGSNTRFDFLLHNNRTNKKAQGLSKNGAEVVNSIKEAVEKSEIIITMLSDDDAVLSVISNKDFLENIKKNSKK